MINDPADELVAESERLGLYSVGDGNHTPPTLKELFYGHQTDKGIHGYHELYEGLGLNRHDVSAVLEVGIGTLDPEAVSTTAGWFPDTYRPGASLRAWADHFPNAIVWGLDPAPDCMFHDHERILTRLCDSTSSEQIAKSIPASRRFDLIVDDGDHTFASQTATLANLWPYVKPGGWYVIEDVYIANFYTMCDVIGHSWHNAIFRPSQSWWFLAIAIPKMA